MMCTRTIATGAGITGNADCPPAFLQSGNPVPLGLWCCAVSSPVAAPGLTRTHMLTAYPRRLNSMSHSPPSTHSLVPWPILFRPRSPPRCSPLACSRYLDETTEHVSTVVGHDLTLAVARLRVCNEHSALCGLRPPGLFLWPAGEVELHRSA
jgi:hypothetical protein